MIKNILNLLIGIFFGFVLMKAEVLSWYRVQEMFRFQSFYMYGVIASSVIVGFVSIQIIKFFHLKTIAGKEIKVQPKPLNVKANLIGGIIFGLGWAITGACPGPVYALIGSGAYAYIVILLSIIVGVFIFGKLKDKNLL